MLGPILPDRPHEPTDSWRTTNVRRSSMFSIGQSGAPVPLQRHFFGIFFFLLHLSPHLPLSLLWKPASRLILAHPRRRLLISHPIQGQSISLSFATRFGLFMFVLQTNGYCACGNGARLFYVRRLRSYTIYDLNRRPALIAWVIQVRPS